MTDCDAVIVGSGPGGSAVADVLTAAGWSVIVVERGRNHLIDLEDPNRLGTDYSNDEIKFMVRHFLGPDPLIEPRTFRSASSGADHDHVGEVNNLPATVGGGGVHADGKVPRFLEVDFRERSEYGPVDDTALDDWPITYDEMEPYYAEAERRVGVAGDASANPFAAWRSGPYPMPPGAAMYGATLSVAAAEKLGYHPYAAPTGANSVPYDGRPACNNCGFCAMYGCPIHAKGDPIGMLRKALLTGRCQVRPETFVTRINVSNGRATGVQYIGSDGQTGEITARHVVVAGGAMETPRLLLLSGLEHPLIGRHLMFHYQTYALGGLPQRVHPHRGRSVTHVHDDHLIPDDESMAAARDAGVPWFRGGLVEHCGPAHPILEARHTPWGAQHKDLMRQSPTRDHLWGFCMQGEDMPQPTNRVDLDPRIRDARGLPVARITYSSHRFELAASKYYGAKLTEILKATGTEWEINYTSPNRYEPISTSRHVMGTARMGDDPATSVVDRWQRMHDVPNVTVADSSVFVTSTGYGPTLTLVALALRAAENLTTA
jgi:gluconate 2-dehydrogenase alpha chain